MSRTTAVLLPACGLVIGMLLAGLAGYTEPRPRPVSSESGIPGASLRTMTTRASASERERDTETDVRVLSGYRRLRFRRLDRLADGDSTLDARLYGASDSDLRRAWDSVDQSPDILRR